MWGAYITAFEGVEVNGSELTLSNACLLNGDKHERLVLCVTPISTKSTDSPIFAIAHLHEDNPHVVLNLSLSGDVILSLETYESFQEARHSKASSSMDSVVIPRMQSNAVVHLLGRTEENDEDSDEDEEEEEEEDELEEEEGVSEEEEEEEEEEDYEEGGGDKEEKVSGHNSSAAPTRTHNKRQKLADSFTVPSGSEDIEHTEDTILTPRDAEEYRAAIIQHLHRHGSTTLAKIGSTIKKPKSVKQKLSKFISQIKATKGKRVGTTLEVEGESVYLIQRSNY